MCKTIKKWYGKSLHMLSLHKGVPRFFAHGGLHLTVLIVLGIIAYMMIMFLRKSYVSSFNQIVYTFYGDTLHNYRINYLSFEKDITRRPDGTINTEDILWEVGYERDSSYKSPMNLPIQGQPEDVEYDLVSKVRYQRCDNIPDTIKTSNPNRYKYIRPYHQLRKTIMLSNHNRYYYSLSTLQDTTHIVDQTTNADDHVVEWGSLNPFFTFWIGINMDNETNLNDKSIIRIKVNDITKYNSQDGIENPLIIEKVLPAPTKMDINEIIYKGEELQAVIRQKGIYVSGTDPIKKEYVERKNLYVTVYLGTIIAFMLDIFIQLILKWRKLK